MLYVGQKVVCVDDGHGQEYEPAGVIVVRDLDGLKMGRVYTVRAVGRRHPNCPFGVMVWLAEIERPIIDGSLSELYGEIGYSPFRFRPVVERKTSIEIFEAMLNPSDKRVEA